MEYTIKVKRMENTMNGTTQGKAFMAMYHLLDGVYSRFPYKNLAVVLSDTSPYIWADGMPADPAAWDDFCEFYNEARDAYSAEFDAAYYTCLRFLKQYDEEWGYPIPYAMEEFTRDKYWEFYYKQV